MDKLNQKQKIATYCGAELFLADNVRLIDIPGTNIVSLTNVSDEEYFIKLNISSIEFSDIKETDKPYYSQKGTIVLSGAMPNQLLYRACRDVVLRLTSTDGRKIVIGNNQFPVRIATEESGKPVVTKLTFEHHHPERAKEFV